MRNSDNVQAIQVMLKNYARKCTRWATPQVTRRAIRQVSAPDYAKGNVLGNVLGNVQARDTGNECMQRTRSS
jgi:hypothetical protein